jgi:hypothetical protein
MAGKVKSAIDQVIAKRTKGSTALIALFKIRLIMNGIDPDQWNESSPDDPQVLARVESIAEGVVKDMDASG